MSIDISILAKAAARGEPDAQINLGLFLLQSGTPRDVARGWEWLRAAESENSPRLLYIEGVCLMQGIGVAPNPQAARACFLRASVNGGAPAEYNFALMCFNGWGGKQDFRRAAEFAYRAARHGFEAARPLREAALARLTADHP